MNFDIEISFHDCNFGKALIGSINNTLYAVELGINSQDSYNNFSKRWIKYQPIMLSRNNHELTSKVLNVINTGNFDPSIIMNLDIGTEFQQKVWKALINIPIGEVVSYASLASIINHPKATRAIGTACKHNPIAVLIPCHRVISSNGNLGNYKWSKLIKQQLLDRENND